MNAAYRKILHELSDKTADRETEKKPSYCEFCGAAVVDFDLHYAFHRKVDELAKTRGVP